MVWLKMGQTISGKPLPRLEQLCRQLNTRRTTANNGHVQGLSVLSLRQDPIHLQEVADQAMLKTPPTAVSRSTASRFARTTFSMYTKSRVWRPSP